MYCSLALSSCLVSAAADAEDLDALASSPVAGLADRTANAAVRRVPVRRRLLTYMRARLLLFWRSRASRATAVARRAAPTLTHPMKSASSSSTPAGGRRRAAPLTPRRAV